MRYPFVGSSYSARSLTAAAQQTMNLIPERIEDPNDTAKGGWTLYGAPGRHLFKDVTTINAAAHPVRGLWSGGGRLFVAAGTKYMELDSSGALAGFGISNIADDAAHSPVTLLSNGNQLLILSAGTVYVDNGFGATAITFPALSGKVDTLANLVIWNATPNSVTGNTDTFDVGMTGQTMTINAVNYTVQAVINPNLLRLTTSAGVQSARDWSSTPILSATSIAFLDDYFIASRTQSRQMNGSGLLNGSSWNPLDFATKESSPDNIRSVIAHDEQLFVFGTEGSEVWQINPQNTAFPFSRIDGAAAKFGSVSAWGPLSIGGRVYFVGGDSQGQLTAYRMDGFTPTRISTHAEESAWNTAGLGPNCVSYGYLEEGHEFWVINFGAQAWVWDATEKTWAQRAQYVASAFTPYDTKFHTFIQNEAGSTNDWGSGKHITAGDASAASGKVYESSINFYDDNGTDIAWRRSIPYRYNGTKQMFFGRMDLEMETGTVASGPAPTITRDFSDDRGHTFTTSQPASIGIHNDFSRLVYWPTGGSSRGRVWRFTGVGQSKVALVDLNCEEVEGLV